MWRAARLPVLGVAPGSASGSAGAVVAVEATRLLHDVRGIGRYVRAMLPRLARLRPGLRLVLTTTRRRDVEALGQAVAADPALGDRAAALHVRGRRAPQADVYWYPWNVAVPAPSRGAVVVTMHDVAPVALPDPRWSRLWKNLRWRRRYASTARHATMILADSSFTANEVVRLLGFPRGRIRVAPLGADDIPVPPFDADTATLARLGVRSPFVLAVGAADRRKNLPLLRDAMTQVLARCPGTSLVLAGPRHRSETRLPAAPWLLTLGFVRDDELSVLYRRAAALVMPSRYEGFGLPVLEAMRLGGPVICARASSLPEVAGDAAVFFDPDDGPDLAAAISRVVADDGLRGRMRAAGLRQALRFGWDETARATLRAFDEAMGLCRALARPGRLPGAEARPPRALRCGSA